MATKVKYRQPSVGSLHCPRRQVEPHPHTTRIIQQGRRFAYTGTVWPASRHHLQRAFGAFHHLSLSRGAPRLGRVHRTNHHHHHPLGLCFPSRIATRSRPFCPHAHPLRLRFVAPPRPLFGQFAGFCLHRDAHCQPVHALGCQFPAFIHSRVVHHCPLSTAILTLPTHNALGQFAPSRLGYRLRFCGSTSGHNAHYSLLFWAFLMLFPTLQPTYTSTHNPLALCHPCLFLCSRRAITP